MNPHPLNSLPAPEARGEERERLQVMSAFASHAVSKSPQPTAVGLRILVRGEAFEATTFDGSPVELSLPVVPEKVDLRKDAAAVSACNVIPQ